MIRRSRARGNYRRRRVGFALLPVLRAALLAVATLDPERRLLQLAPCLQIAALVLTCAKGRAAPLLPHPVRLDLASMPIVHAFRDTFELSAAHGAYLLVNAS